MRGLLAVSVFPEVRTRTFVKTDGALSRPVGEVSRHL